MAKPSKGQKKPLTTAPKGTVIIYGNVTEITDSEMFLIQDFFDRLQINFQVSDFDVEQTNEKVKLAVEDKFQGNQYKNNDFVNSNKK